MWEIRKHTVKGLKPGDVFTVSRIFSETETIQFAEITKDYNPVHFDERFTEIKGFSGCICHGLLAASLITEIGGEIGWLASGMSFSFKKPVYFGDTITCRMTITKIDNKGKAEAQAVYTNQNDETVLLADLTGIVPGEKEISVMKSLLAEGGPVKSI